MALAPKELIEIVEKGNVDEVREYLAAHSTPVDAVDQDGMSLLMHASFKSKADVCKLLVARKADVNCVVPENGYTALMFAAVAGSTDCVRILLEAGSNASKLNSINRTAAQLAAFVGNGAVAMTINCFFPRSSLDYYSVPHGVEKQAKLPPYVVPSLHDLLNSANIHPVHILLYLQANAELLHESSKISPVIDLLVEKQFKEAHSEVLSVKFHLIASVLKFATTSSSGSAGSNLDSRIKYLLQFREQDGFPLNLDSFLRQSIREYPYHQCQLIAPAVRAITNINMTPGTYAKGGPTTLKVLHSILFGIQFYDESKLCVTCGKDSDLRKCTGCKEVSYCGRNCQSLHWSVHKKMCQAAKKAMEKKSAKASPAASAVAAEAAGTEGKKASS